MVRTKSSLFQTKFQKFFQQRNKKIFKSYKKPLSAHVLRIKTVNSFLTRIRSEPSFNAKARFNDQIIVTANFQKKTTITPAHPMYPDFKIDGMRHNWPREWKDVMHFYDPRIICFYDSYSGQQLIHVAPEPPSPPISSTSMTSDEKHHRREIMRDEDEETELCALGPQSPLPRLDLLYSDCQGVPWEFDQLATPALTFTPNDDNSELTPTSPEAEVESTPAILDRLCNPECAIENQSHNGQCRDDCGMPLPKKMLFGQYVCHPKCHYYFYTQEVKETPEQIVERIIKKKLF